MTVTPPPFPGDAGPLRSRVRRATMAVYAMLSLAGVIAAASYKNYVADANELSVVILGTSLSIVIAHSWAEFAAHRLVTGGRLDRDQVADELRYVAAFLVPGLGLCALALLLGTGDMSIHDISDRCLDLLTVALFVVGLVGARRAGKSWARSVAWGLLDAGICALVLGLKLVLGG